MASIVTVHVSLVPPDIERSARVWELELGAFR
jgi:hypothetical protein